MGFVGAYAQSNHGSSAGYTIGFDKAYDLISKTLNTLQSVSAGLTLRYDPVTFNGQVWQYQDPTQNNYNYHYQIRPISLFAESDIVIAKFHCVSPFAILGLGLTEANLTYHETAINGAQPISAQSGSKWLVKPDVVVGAGLLWDFKNPHYFLKTQYLYQYRGMARFGGIAAFAQGVPVNLNEQSVDVLFGMRLS